MDDVELTPDQRTAHAQVEMLKIFKFTVVFILVLMSFNAYTGWSGQKGVKEARYEKDRAEDRKERERMNAKMDKILDSVRNTEKDIAVIKERERLREKRDE